MVESEPRSNSPVSAEEPENVAPCDNESSSTTGDQRQESSRTSGDDEKPKKIKKKKKKKTKKKMKKKIKKIEQGVKQESRDSTRSSNSGRTSDPETKEIDVQPSGPTSNHGVGGVQPGAYASSIDMAGRMSSRRSTITNLNDSISSIQEPLNFPNESNNESLDLMDGDDDDSTHLLSAQEIEDQRTKLTIRSNSTGMSGAQPEISDSLSKTGVFGSGETSPTSISSRSHQRGSSSAHVEARTVEEIEDERMVRLEEANQQLLREMQDLRRGSFFPVIVQAEEARPTFSKRTLIQILIGLCVFFVVVVAGTVAGVTTAARDDGEEGSLNLPTPGPTPSSGASCRDWSEYFDGKVKSDALEEGKYYDIGCKSRPSTLMALVADENNCVRCLGMLEESDYGDQCDAVSCMLFQIEGTVPLGETVALEYAGQLAIDEVVPSCPRLTLVDNDGSLCFSGGDGGPDGGGGGGPGGK